MTRNNVRNITKNLFMVPPYLAKYINCNMRAMGETANVGGVMSETNPDYS